MTSTDNPSPYTEPTLKKRATQTLLAGGLAMAGLGLGAGTANADQPTLTCPATVAPGGSGTVTAAGFLIPNDPVDVTEDGGKYWGPGPGGQSGDSHDPNGAIAVTWPSAPPGPAHFLGDSGRPGCGGDLQLHGSSTAARGPNGKGIRRVRNTASGASPYLNARSGALAVAPAGFYPPQPQSRPGSGRSWRAQHLHNSDPYRT
jgi:hypothetical protein